jgi:osmoprotectant transport system permease protein
VLLVAPRRPNDPLLRRALKPLVGAIPVELMREASYRVDRDADKEPLAAAARRLAQRALPARR